MVSKNHFYREVSLTLSANLDFNMAIHRCVEVLKNYMPADGINIQLLEPALKSSRSVISSFADYAEMNTLKDTDWSSLGARGTKVTTASMIRLALAIQTGTASVPAGNTGITRSTSV